MTFEEWWEENKQFCDEVYKHLFESAFNAGAAAMRERCVEVAASFKGHNSNGSWIAKHIRKLEV